jgi:SAM-dependent methyltransferase
METMKRCELARYRESNARAWSLLARQGYDVYRDHLNTPAFLDFLPDIEGLHGLDIGCRDGHNTRQLSRRGATVTAIDIAPTFIHFAKGNERYGPGEVESPVGDGRGATSISTGPLCFSSLTPSSSTASTRGKIPSHGSVFLRVLQGEIVFPENLECARADACFALDRIC